MNRFIANTVLMVRPVQFGFNEEAAETNSFQHRLESLSARQIQEVASLEFDAFVATLRDNGIKVKVFNDTLDFHTPDSIFPNNWFSTCPHSKTIYAYPMKNESRSAERREDIVEDLKKDTGFSYDDSLLSYESKDKSLEGTGSLVLDHQNKLAYAALSPRTEKTILDKWCQKTGFEAIIFHTLDKDGGEIYHTNVMMTMADEYAVIALETIHNQNERIQVDQILASTGKDVIDITIDQMEQFAGNMLQLQNDKGEKFLVMSSTAELSLTYLQRKMIEDKHQNTILSSPVNIIETIGGGSARCMMAEVFR